MKRITRLSVTAETILVVNDSESLGELINIILSRVGYSVLSAANAAEGLRIAESIRAIDLLITSVDMPQMRGDQLATRFAEICRSAHIIMVSRANEWIETGEAFECLAMPFTAGELRQAVRRVLHPTLPLVEMSAVA